MRLHHFALASATLLLVACGGTKEETQVTETRLDDLDSLEGTISDDAINMDESTDEAPVEAAPSADSAPKKGNEPAVKLDPAQAKDSGGPDIVKIEPNSDQQ
jgi:hypothetical protein